MSTMFGISKKYPSMPRLFGGEWGDRELIQADSPERAIATWGDWSEHGSVLLLLEWTDESGEQAWVYELAKVADGDYDFQTTTSRQGKYKAVRT